MTKANPPSSRTAITLANWRHTPHNRFAFHRVSEFIGTAPIRKSRHTAPLHRDLVRPEDFPGEITSSSLETWLARSDTDAFVVLKEGAIVLEWYASHYEGVEPHILFSISKSVTGALAGILNASGIFDPTARVMDYLPKAAACGYGECTVQQLLDMQAAIAFDEDYLDQTGQFARYRVATGWNPPQAGVTPTEGLAEFLMTLQASDKPHGETFRYLSPNSDLLGIILERATGKRYADLLSKYLWQPLGFEHDGYVTVDSVGTARSAGGVCVHPHDLARLGQAISVAASGRGNGVIPDRWIDDTLTAGNQRAWRNGEFVQLLPQGNYRNQWYLTGGQAQAICAIGIHGQWLYIDPRRNITIVKLSSQIDPLSESVEMESIETFERIATQFQS
jgi:CubicO group peptidase (beta-lactamase class C family)